MVWCLVVGCWLLVVGCWLLVVGCWLSETIRVSLVLVGTARIILVYFILMNLRYQAKNLFLDRL
ncbi:MAG TPA: hypothetical protein DCL61_23205 [Cyanobacteria bacterium UBA12227]|nr:hypothetical protein [Cyanobacteria bacterium UBA12227]HAX87367.1 hypothetical protein [Cyanobacteria bacterium UBA11370]HBY80893.1 hypothetical protein [Cyanobacteria bacterium UBA11148]